MFERRQKATYRSRFFYVMIMLKKKIILASGSPRRQHLLNQIGINFEVRQSSIEELFDPISTPEENAQRLAEAKASEIAKYYDDAYIIGADTIVVLDGEMMAKPADDADAFRMLSTLSGKEHRVITGFAIFEKPSGRYISDTETTYVKFRSLSEKEIRDYIKSKSPSDKAGAYGIQDDFGAVFVEKINGCFYNVVGFPLTRFYVDFIKFQKELSTE